MKTYPKIPLHLKVLSVIIGLAALLSFSSAHAAAILYTAEGNTAPLSAVGQYFPSGGGTNNPTFLTNASNGLFKPYAVAVDSAGNVYIANFGNGQVSKYDVTSHVYTANFIATSGVWGLAITGNTIYVGSYNSGTVNAYDLTTKTAIGGFTAITGLTNPTNLLLDGSGNLYVANFGANKVTRYSATTGAGSGTDVITGFTHASGLALDGAGNLYVSSDTTTTIGRYNIAGNSFNPSYITSIPINVYGLAADGAGFLYDTDYNGGRISKYNITSPTSGSLDTLNYITGIPQVAGITFVPAAVPEPSMVAFLCIGGIAFGAWRTRRVFRIG